MGFGAINLEFSWPRAVLWGMVTFEEGCLWEL
jgi:hypothetical protein